MKIKIDGSFGISNASLKVLDILKHYKFEVNVDTAPTLRTSPFFNGRERAICITSYHHKKDALFVVFGEHRNSDQIFVDAWHGPNTFNPPTLNDFTEEAYKNRKFFKWNEELKAAKYIRTLINSYMGNVR